MKFVGIGRKAVITAAAMAGLAAAIGAAPATAESAPSGEIGVLGNAPSCVKVWVDVGTITQTGWAENQCGYRMNLKIIWAWGADGACHSVGNGGKISSKVAREPRVFDGASTC
jgi:hypothetical protein